MARFAREIDFTSLSVRDLLEAREHYHVHLANLENVIGTAVGRYRIRHKDPDYDDPRADKSKDDPSPRTLTNSSVRPWSWPCILVFVNHWETRGELAARPAQFVPPRLYLPDGRVAPTCVVLAPLRFRRSAAGAAAVVSVRPHRGWLSDPHRRSRRVAGGHDRLPRDGRLVRLRAERGARGRRHRHTGLHAPERTARADRRERSQGSAEGHARDHLTCGRPSATRPPRAWPRAP